MLPRVNASSAYTKDIMLNLLKKSINHDPNWDYLATTQKGGITKENREDLHGWIFNVCDVLNTTFSTKELAWNFSDTFLKYTTVRKSILQLIGISSIQLAIKINESFIVDLETLAELCGHQYSIQNIIQFEELMLDKLGWNPWKPTACETMTHLNSLLEEVAKEACIRGNKTCEQITTLAKIFKTSEFQQKAFIFLQIAILDYDLSRFSAFVLWVVAALWVLKANNHLFLKFIILKSFPEEDFVSQLDAAMKVAKDLFNLPLSEDEFEKFQQLFDDIDEEGEKTMKEDSCSYNKELSRDGSSSTLEYSTKEIPLLGDGSQGSISNPSPLKNSRRNWKEEVDQENVSYDSMKREKMLKIKRKVISKQKLN